MLAGNNILTLSSNCILLSKNQVENNFDFHIFILIGILLYLLLIISPSEATAESFLYSWGSSGRDIAEFDKPWGIAIDSKNNVYVVDNNNHRIQKFSNNGKFLSSWGSFGSDHGDFSYPHGIAIDSKNNVYVVDNNNHRIQKFSNNGKFLSSWGSFGSDHGDFSYPHGIAIDSKNNVYVADTDNNRIQKFSNNGKFLSSWGIQGVGDGEFYTPWGIAIDSKNNVYVVDNNNRVQKFSNTGEFLSSWGSEQLEFPKNIHISPDDIVYVADVGSNQIQVFASTGKLITSWGSTGKGFGSFLSPTGIAINSLGNVFVVDHVNDRIQVFTSILDTQKPIITVPPNIIAETEVEKGTSVSFNVVASDNVRVVGSPQCDYPSQSIFPIGTTVVTCKARDVAGNVGSASFEVLVKYNESVKPENEEPVTPLSDTQKPIITVPPNIIAETEVEKGTSVSFNVVASDNVRVVGSPQCDYPSQSIFPIGTTVVTCKARDVAGNVGSASFEVLVKYNESVDYTTELAVTTVGLASTLGTVIAYKTGLVGSKASVISKPASYSGSSSNGNPSYDLSSEIFQESISESNTNEHLEQVRTPSIEIAVSWGFEK